jgi:transcriptional regulator with XRE-family HTH domain
MHSVDRETVFNDALRARIKALRESRGWTQQGMAIALGIPFERYSKYESRSPLPGYLIEQFSQIVGYDVDYVLTGRFSAGRRAA